MKHTLKKINIGEKYVVLKEAAFNNIMKIFLLGLACIFVMDFDFTSFAEDVCDSEENQSQNSKINKKYIFLGFIILSIMIILIIKSGGDISSVNDVSPSVENVDVQDVNKKVDNILNYLKNNKELMNEINKKITEDGVNNLKR
jgi:hypothetical protein